MTAVLAPEATDVRTLVEEVWSSFLGEDDPVVPADPGDFPVGWSAAVTISGAWAGMVSLELPGAAAEQVTRRMLALSDEDEASDEDVADAIGELVNMIGGNVKSLMPGPSELSLPVVAAGRVALGSDAVEACRVGAAWAGQPFVVDVSVRPAQLP